MRLRMVLALVAWSTLLLALTACTSSIAGTATYGGPTQTSEESTEEETTEEESTEEETTEEETSEDAPFPGEPAELAACISVLFAYQTANDNFIALADANSAGTPTDLTAESVAVDFDAAIASVQPSLDPLPSGAVRDAVQAAQNAAAALRDGLRAGSASNTDLLAALDSLTTACDF